MRRTPRSGIRAQRPFNLGKLETGRGRRKAWGTDSAAPASPRPHGLVEVTGGPDAALPSLSPPFLAPSATERGDETPAFSPLSKSACLHLGDFGAVRDICS